MDFVASSFEFFSGLNVFVVVVFDVDVDVEVDVVVVVVVVVVLVVFGVVFVGRQDQMPLLASLVHAGEWDSGAFGVTKGTNYWGSVFFYPRKPSGSRSSRSEDPRDKHTPRSVGRASRRS